MNDLIQRLNDESDLCRNEGADDIANLLDEAIAALSSVEAKPVAYYLEWGDDWNEYRHADEMPDNQWRSPPTKVVPLYAAPLASVEAQSRLSEAPQPLKRGKTGFCSRKSGCLCEREGLGDECVYLRPNDAELERRTGEPHIDGYPLLSGLPPAQCPQAQTAQAHSRLTDERIIAIAKTWAKEPGWLEFERNDFIACVRQCFEVAADGSANHG